MRRQRRRRRRRGADDDDLNGRRRRHRSSIGQAWTFATGETNAALSTPDEFWVDLYAATFDTCVAFGAPSNADEVIMMMPKTPGSYPLSLARNATLYVASSSDNWVATLRAPGD